MPRPSAAFARPIARAASARCASKRSNSSSMRSIWRLNRSMVLADIVEKETGNACGARLQGRGDVAPLVAVLARVGVMSAAHRKLLRVAQRPLDHAHAPEFLVAALTQPVSRQRAELPQVTREGRAQRLHRLRQVSVRTAERLRDDVVDHAERKQVL